MRGHISCVLAATLVIPTAARAQEATAQSMAAGSVNSNQYICRFDDSVNSSAVRAEADKAAGPELGQVLHTYTNTIRGFAVRLAASSAATNAIARLRANNPRIAECISDGVTRAAMQRRPGGGGSTSGQTTPWGVARVGGPGDASSSTKKAWIIDSGIDLDHPDLTVDTTNGYDFIDSDNIPDDGFGHGTHVAGTIGAKNNDFGVVGVAAGITLVPIRVLDNQGIGPDSGVIAAIDYVAGLAAVGDVINLSLVADAPDQIMDDAVAAVAAKGIFVTIAAGNSSANAGNYSPGRTNGPNIFTVSAFGSRDTWARFSNYGNPPIDYGEPGDSIRSTYKSGTYATLSGTSMAAPHLAGILLLNAAGPSVGGNVKRDPDGNADIIGIR